MGRLQEHEFDDNQCAECRAKVAVGPCAACEAMICGDCGVLTKDPNGTKCICHSCARLIAEVGERPRRDRSAATGVVAYALVFAFALASIGGLYALLN